MQLGNHIVVAVVEAGSCSSKLTPSLGTSIGHRCGPNEQKNCSVVSKRLDTSLVSPPFHSRKRGRKSGVMMKVDICVGCRSH